MRATGIRLSIGMVLGLAATVPAAAGEYFFTFGGGYAPPGNQVSLEKNVLYFQRFLRLRQLDGARQHYLFADGNDPNRDLQYDDPREHPTELRTTLAAIFQGENGVKLNYRSNHIPRLNGRCGIDTVDAWFKDTGSHLEPGDRLIMYFTGHGGRGPDNDPRNTTLQVWLGQKYTVKEFTQRLNKIPPQVPVVLVMVQCYAGGFATVIFRDGDPTQGLAEHPRAGFFATDYHQQAAGCTPDINEADYQEYSSFFWAALCGESRLGEKVDKPDYNGDGQVDFSEAHAYAILTDPSIDLPLKTSDVFLRACSAAYPEKTLDQQTADRYVTPEIYSRLIAVATPRDRAVLEGLSGLLGLTGDQRTVAARQLADEALKKRDAADRRKNEVSQEYNHTRTVLSHFLQEGWPELANPWHPRVEKILGEESAAIGDNLRRHPRFPQMKTQQDEMEKLTLEIRDLDRHWARCQRFLFRTESVACEANLPLVADEEVQQRYQRLVELETGTLSSPADPAKGPPAGSPGNP